MSMYLSERLLSSLAARRPPFEFWLYYEFVIYGTFLLFSGSVGLLVRNLRDEEERSEALLRQVNGSRARPRAGTPPDPGIRRALPGGQGVDLDDL